MSRIVRRYVILFFAIAIPLTAAFLVGSYGYNSDKFGQKQWKEEFAAEYLTFEGEYTTRDKIERFMKYGVNNQYHSYDATPIYEAEIKSGDSEKLFDLLVYRAVYNYNIKDVAHDRFQYIYFFYNVQYQNIRDLFVADESLRKEINEVNVPTFSPKIIEVIEEGDEDPKTRSITQIPETDLSFPDYDSDVDFKSGKSSTDEDVAETDTLVKVFMGFVPMREINVPTKYTVKIDAVINKIVDDKGESIKTEIASFEMELEVNPENMDYSDYTKSHMQDLTSAGYFGWAFKNYLWWISLIAFVAVGLITGSFYLVYLSEEKRLLEEAKKRKRK